MNNITLTALIRMFFAHCSFFTLGKCDRDHSISWPTPYINVIQITPNGARWTVERFGARFRIIKQGPATSAVRFTTNLGH